MDVRYNIHAFRWDAFVCAFFVDNPIFGIHPITREQFYIIKSYNTLVARIVPGDAVYQLGWWSQTTQRHINYVAFCLGLPIKTK